MWFMACCKKMESIRSYRTNVIQGNQIPIPCAQLYAAHGTIPNHFLVGTTLPHPSIFIGLSYLCSIANGLVSMSVELRGLI